MKPEGLTKMLIHDDDGTAIAYTREGIVYSVGSGSRIAKLQAGQIYSLDGQFLGTRLPSGKVRGVEGEPAAFLRLVRKD
ncbi:4-fold beta flower protein [Acidisoma sp. S159]|uniref:4-fold beta flower protein n=1 Tax=Acidisoma sp. S159 TaxID=1747225 RepID=UPI00131DCD4C|nr:hypothetical protein [Acidisoma sp. S159]